MFSSVGAAKAVVKVDYTDAQTGDKFYLMIPETDLDLNANRTVMSVCGYNMCPNPPQMDIAIFLSPPLNTEHLNKHIKYNANCEGVKPALQAALALFRKSHFSQFV